MSQSTLTTPKRIQRKRAKGWRMPENARSVTRPGKFGNPFRVGVDCVDAESAVRIFRLWVLASEDRLAVIREELKGRDLACFCREGAPCHADVLLKLANEPEVRQ